MTISLNSSAAANAFPAGDSPFSLPNLDIGAIKLK